MAGLFPRNVATAAAAAEADAEVRHIRFGLAYSYLDGDRTTASAPSRRAYEPHWGEILEQVSWAESVGLSSIWFGEHHFDAMCPSPNIIAAAAAMRTKNGASQ